MICWKTINLSRDFGNHRLISISIIIMFLSFIIMYVPLSIINENIHLNDNGLPLFLIGLFIMIPVHIICHAIPAWITSKKTKIRLSFGFMFMPTFQIQYLDSMGKFIKVLSILSPTLFITVPLVSASILFPVYMHYLLILAAYNIGLSLTDYIYLKHLIKAPKKCQIDQTNDTFDILIHRAQ
ncbi:DUF3267 domain-containing protein [Bacillus sp. Marseille-P3661]|uniref:DUF3267 domain-containing protein n=1 Tax=Bacillus sp. Marseille-P3661 TaxID=1936234 RepID=UPI000C8356C7|nr:DUF3267 domain-containing protein [Bacillus sp. Marseille-P3661]